MQNTLGVVFVVVVAVACSFFVCLLCVCVCVRACVRACVRVCVLFFVFPLFVGGFRLEVIIIAHQLHRPTLSDVRRSRSLSVSEFKAEARQKSDTRKTKHIVFARFTSLTPVKA